MKKDILSIILLVIFASCKTNEKVFEKKAKPLPINEKLTFSNHIYKLDTIARSYDDFNLGSRNYSTVLGLFQISRNHSINFVSLKIDEKGLAMLEYTDSSVTKNVTLKFKRKKKGYYQYFVKRKIIEIPPIVCILYGLRETDRLRLKLTPDGDLLIQEKYVDNHNILFLGGGGQYKQLFYFRKG